ncbi:hypothetical protein VW23_006245 [Devosia insulae DS-56]|uniref:Imm-5-like domain-containing protein n=1 Tax=Devosia insulae DS-56 TaxID=1116389 RepID=A0A1E5XI26_9HYPH|nr:hypothetical protein [Devosia insulae]OEO28134.1 hypothetical protein VW23_006245 [Devosia insulae DS-56]
MRYSDADHRLLASWAADCAEHVLERFERDCPDDPRPREAIAAARAWVRGELPMVEARAAAFAAHAAARTASDATAVAAARAAGHAAATAHVASHAPHAARYARKAAGAAAEMDWQRESLPEHLHAVLAA